MSSPLKEDSKNIHQKLFYPGTKKRKIFGLLERPSLPPSIPQVSYKVFVTGRAASGKSYLVSRFAGYEPSNLYMETIGIDVNHVYWPMKIGNRLMLFRLELWDTGEATSKRYNHIKSACNEAVDAVLVCFAATNYDQWRDIPHLLSTAAQPSEKASLMVIATRWDRPNDIAVSEADLRNFESEKGVPILRLPPASSHPGEDLNSIAPLLNFICRQLWQRDQQLLASGKDKKQNSS